MALCFCLLLFCLRMTLPRVDLDLPLLQKAGDTLLLELASSPGRIVGDASGRWGVGAVPESELAATLHVFASPIAAEPSG